MAKNEQPRSPWMTAALIGGTLVLLLGAFLGIQLILEEDNEASGWLTDFIGRQVPIEELDEQGQPKTPRTEKEKQEYIQWRQRNRAGSGQPSPATKAPKDGR